MLKLFGKIRQRLLDDGQFTKYLIYAFGEILLVVIGILIALQVNNFNENRKIKTYEIEILKDLIMGIKDDSTSIKYNIDRHSEAINSCKILLNIHNKNIGYNDSLAYHFAAIHYITLFEENIGAYESLKSKGVETISNKELRFKIINLYEKWYPLVQQNDEILTNDVLHIKRNFNPKHFDKFQLFEIAPPAFIYNGEMIPNNITQLQNNVEYKYFLNSLLSSHSAVLAFYIYIKEMGSIIINESNSEIQKLEG